MKKTLFEGVATALVTPMNKDGSVDYAALDKLVDWQIEQGINALVACGTTGEASTLTDDEHRDVIARVVERADKRVPVIAGTGSNDLEYALSLTKYACDAGADAVLTVTPYYNKATQAGLIQMYNKLADASRAPVILYNVPSRTGVNIAPTTYKALADHENIIAIKEANGDISKIVETMSYVNGKLDLYSGNDDQVVPLMSLGGKGVISVVSNILPAKTVLMTKKCLEGDYAGAAKIQYDLHAVIDSLFSEVNPIPVKAATAKMGFGTNTLRLPLTPMSEDKYEKMLTLMRAQGLDV
ncbi:MAG: 4-hydroxy-tetrahydrodipicolinate synthase [Clostridia bacterium]|nr:4-hydroxy-tetrahydrodipicolinate synthase [Clostridia bacterium]